MPIIKHECQNCGVLWDESDLLPVKDIAERVSEGEDMPSGECQDCGAVCHEVTITVRSRFKVTENDSEYGNFNVFGETREIKELDGLYETAINDSLDLVRELAKVEFPSPPSTQTAKANNLALLNFVREFSELILKARMIPGAYETKES